jgi:hypothetical protein
MSRGGSPGEDARAVDMPAPARASVLARWLSILLHPFAVLTVLALLAAWRLDPGELLRIATVVASMVAVTWAFVLWRKRSGRWSTVDASRRQERPVLYALLLVLVAACWWWMGGTASPMARGIAIIGAMLATAAVLNLWIKLSLHMASLAFAGVALTALMPVAGVVALCLLPLLAWSRLRMARHTWPEVVAGALLGFAFGLLTRWP